MTNVCCKLKQTAVDTLNNALRHVLPRPPGQSPDL